MIAKTVVQSFDYVLREILRRNPNAYTSKNLRVVVISEGQSPGVLTKMNSVIRRIDLTCKLVAPVVTGFIISFVSLTASATTLALWNIATVFLIYFLLMSVYNGIPRLSDASERRASRSSIREVDESTSAYHEQESLIPSRSNDNEPTESSSNSKSTIIEKLKASPYINAWRVYIKQEVALPGLALALLFFTVLR